MASSAVTSSAVTENGPAGGLLEPDEMLLRALAPEAAPPEITRFTRWDEELQRALESIEEGAFPPDLRYSCGEMRERAAHPGFEGVLLAGPVGGATSERLGATSPAAIMFVYRPDPATIYLDTLAVRHRGRGVGSALLRFLIRCCDGAPENGRIREIRLDAEGGASSPLRAYYQRFGFSVTAEDGETGNITMVRAVGQSG